MRKLTYLSFLFCLALQEQEFRRATGYMGGGFGTPLGDFGERRNTGWNVLAGGGIRLTQMFGINLEYTYNQLNYRFTVTPRIGQVVPTPLNGETQLHGFSLSPRITTPRVLGG